jgi:hypothetical protein
VTVIHDSSNKASSAVILALVKGIWVTVKLKFFFFARKHFWCHGQQIEFLLDCDYKSCVRQQIFKEKPKVFLMKVIAVAGAGGIFSRLAFLAVCCLSCYIGARLLSII